MTDFTYEQHCNWAKEVSENTVICQINSTCGVGVYVPVGRSLRTGTFIPSTGVLDFSLQDITENYHATIFYNPASEIIIGCINPKSSGAILSLINHAFNKDQLKNIQFFSSSVAQKAALPNLKFCQKYWNGIAINGYEVIKNIAGGQQLLCSYANVTEYFSDLKNLQPNKPFFVFNKKTGDILDTKNYEFKVINIHAVRGNTTASVSVIRWGVNKDNMPFKFLLDVPGIDAQGKKHNLQVPGSYILVKLKLFPDIQDIIYDLPEESFAATLQSCALLSDSIVTTNSNVSKNSFFKKEAFSKIIEKLNNVLPPENNAVNFWQYNEITKLASIVFCEDATDLNQLRTIRDHVRQYTEAGKIEDVKIMRNTKGELIFQFTLLETSILEKIPPISLGTVVKLAAIDPILIVH